MDCIIWHFKVEYDAKYYNSSKFPGREAIHMTWKEFKKFSYYFPEKYVYQVIHDNLDSFLYYISEDGDYFPIQFDTYFDYLRYCYYIKRLKRNKATEYDKSCKMKQNKYKAQMLSELRTIVLAELKKSEEQIGSVDRPTIYSPDEIQTMLGEKNDMLEVGF